MPKLKTAVRTSEAPAETLLVVTVAYVRPLQLWPFYAQSRRVLLDIERRPGRLAHDIRLLRLGTEAWTYSWWRDAVSLQEFVDGDEHTRAMASARRLLSRVKTWRYACPAGIDLLTWDGVDAVRAGELACRLLPARQDRVVHGSESTRPRAPSRPR